jgi:indolepyruvate ferredoxin oxidoreductase beta subunit
MTGDASGTVNLIFAGVGGQGVLLIAELAAETALRAGYDVKQTEVHGVSQRGGSVESHVRFGAEIHSPLVMAGEADVVVGLEKLEGLRFAHTLRAGPPGGPDQRPIRAGPPAGILLVNEHEIIPASVVDAADRYPHHAVEFLLDRGVPVIGLPASAWARDLGDGRMANLVMLGALSALLTLPEDLWAEQLQQRLPERIREANVSAFTRGRDHVRTRLGAALAAEGG